MKYHWSFVALGLLVAGFGETPAMAQQASMTAADVAKIQAVTSAQPLQIGSRLLSSKDIHAIVEKMGASGDPVWT